MVQHGPDDHRWVEQSVQKSESEKAMTTRIVYECECGLQAVSHQSFTILARRRNGRRLTDEQVREIRERWSEGESQYGLSQAFGLSQPSVRSVIMRESYKDVE